MRSLVFRHLLCSDEGGRNEAAGVRHASGAARLPGGPRDACAEVGGLMGYGIGRTGTYRLIGLHGANTQRAEAGRRTRQSYEDGLPIIRHFRLRARRSECLASSRWSMASKDRGRRCGTSPSGTSRRSTAAHHHGGNWDRPDMRRCLAPLASDVNDPERTPRHKSRYALVRPRRRRDFVPVACQHADRMKGRMSASGTYRTCPAKSTLMTPEAVVSQRSYP